MPEFIPTTSADGVPLQARDAAGTPSDAARGEAGPPSATCTRRVFVAGAAVAAASGFASLAAQSPADPAAPPAADQAAEPSTPKANDHPPAPKANVKAFLENGRLKVGVDLARGGSIALLADLQGRRDAEGKVRGGAGESVVNVQDLGRYIGQSYYAGPKPFGKPHPNWPAWPWNPVSAGDVYNNPCKLLESTNDGRTLYVKSQPMQWALENVPADCVFETWISLEGSTVQVRNRLTNARDDKRQFPAMDQEVPAVYTVGTLHRLKTYDGDRPFSGGALSEIPKRPEKENMPQWNSFRATEHWAALVDDFDWGLGVVHPGVVRFLGGFYLTPGKGGPHDPPTGYVSPVRPEMLDHDAVYEYEYTLVLDTLTKIRETAYKLRPKSSAPDDRFGGDSPANGGRRHWRLAHARDDGAPRGDRGWKVHLDQPDPQLLGPESAWRAEEAPKLHLDAAFRTKHSTAELYWSRHDAPGFAAERSVRFEVQPDGERRIYTIDLAASPEYRGLIAGIRLDPVASGGLAEFVEVFSFSHRAPRKLPESKE